MRAATLECVSYVGEIEQRRGLPLISMRSTITFATHWRVGLVESPQMLVV